VQGSLRWSLAFLDLTVSCDENKKRKKNNLERVIQEINEVQLFQQANVFSWTVVHMLNCVMKESANYL